MDRLLVLVHTVPPLMDLFERLGTEMLPDVRRKHILDEALLERVRQRGRLSVSDVRRVRSHVEWSRQIGADIVLVTCSTVSPCVDYVREGTRIPIIKIDEAMIEKAVASGGKLGVVATNRATIEPTRAMLDAEAEKQGKQIEVEFTYVDEALAAIIARDHEKHNRLVKPAVLEMMERSDVVMLAQASIASVLDVIPPDERKTPILSSPHLAMAQTKSVLDAARAALDQPVTAAAPA